MKLKIALIFFYLILSVISLNLKKKNENKKTLNRITSFLQNKKKNFQIVQQLLTEKQEKNATLVPNVFHINA